MELKELLEKIKESQKLLSSSGMAPTMLKIILKLV